MTIMNSTPPATDTTGIFLERVRSPSFPNLYKSNSCTVTDAAAGFPVLRCDRSSVLRHGTVITSSGTRLFGSLATHQRSPHQLSIVLR